MKSNCAKEQFYLVRYSSPDLLAYNCIQVIGEFAEMYAWVNSNLSGRSNIYKIGKGKIKSGNYIDDEDLKTYSLSSNLRRSFPGVLINFKSTNIASNVIR